MSVPLSQAGSLRSSADPGLETRPVDALLAAHEGLIARIKLSFGVDHPTFSRDVLPLIRAYADYVYWLPATADDLFDRPGGLFHLSLETAFYSIQGTDAHIFSGKLPISARRHLEPRWRRATFLAGLCGELHRAIGQVEVRDDDGALWPALLHPLSTWLERRAARHYHLRWRTPANEVRSLGLLALPQVVPADVLQFLAEDNEVVLPHLMASIGGLPLYHGRNVLDELARRAFALVVERDLIAHAGPGRMPRQGRHQTRYLVEGLQRLIANDSTWRPNQEKSRAWYGSDGLYLVWPGAANDLHHLLEGEQIAGMPDAPEAMLARLTDLELIELACDGNAFWRIRPPGADAALQAIKLTSPALFLDPLETSPSPLPQALALEVTAPPSPPPAPVPEATNGGQLTLIAPKATAAAEEFTSASIDRVKARLPGWRLKAPLRLNAAVNHTLAAILGDPSADLARDKRTDTLFVPLRLFEAHHLTPAIAIRALSDAGMLSVDASQMTPTVQRPDSNGHMVAGIRLKGRFAEAN